MTYEPVVAEVMQLPAQERLRLLEVIAASLQVEHPYTLSVLLTVALSLTRCVSLWTTKRTKGHEGRERDYRGECLSRLSRFFRGLRGPNL